MPSAVLSFIGSKLVAIGSAIGAAGASAGVAMAVGAAAVVAGAVAAQKLISELYSIPNLDSDRSRQATVRGTVEPQKLIYGEALVSGPISFVGVSGTDNRDLYHSIVLAGHPSDSISDIYFDDERIQSAHINSAGNVTTGVFGPKDGTTICVVRKLTGSQTTADSVLDGAFNTINSSEHIGTNLTYIVTKFTLTEESQETWDKFLPNDIKALVKGKKVYDPRQDNTSTYYDASVGVATQRSTNSATWAWSDNPVWCLIDYLTDDRFGMDINLDRIDLSKAVDAADICDATVSVPGGTESRYTCNGVIFGTTTHKTNINKILSAMNGMLTYTNGKYVIRAGAFESVGTGMNLTEDNMIGPVKLKTSFERNERFNTITGTFIDPSKSFKEIEFPKVQITSALTRDNNEELTRELKLSMTNSRYMAQRISHKLIQLSDLQKVLTFPTNLAGVNISVGDRVNVTLSEFGYTNKTFVCLGWTLSESGAGGVNLTLREDDSSSYADLAVSGYSTVTPAGGIEQGFFGVPDPSGLSATSHVESIELDWTNPANMTGIIAVEIFASPNSSWSSAVKIGETIGTQFIHDESNGVDAIVENDQRYYWVRARRFPAGEGSDAVSDRNPDSDTSTVQATKGALGNLADLDTVGDSQIDDNAVTNRTIADDAVDTDQINNGAVDTDQIANDAVTFDKIDVNELSAITADLGDITAGTIQSVPSDSALSAIPTDVFTRSSNQNIPTGTESGAFIDLAEGSFLFGDSESFISFAENSGGTAYELDIKGVLAPTSLDFSGVTATTPMPSNIKVSGYADASIGVNAISEAVYAEIATRVGTGSGGFYSSEDDHYLGESAKYITIGTTQNHGTGDVTVQVAISDSFGYPRNFAVNSDQLKIKITLQYKVASGSTWVAAGSTQTRALTPTILQYATVYSIDESYSVTLTSGSGQDIADSTDYDFRVKLERVGSVSAFATVANGGANDTTGTPVTLEVSEGQAGSSVDNANTLDNLDSTQFLRSDADDTLTGDLTLVGALKMGDTRRIELGDDTDLKISHSGGGGKVENDTGNLTIKNRAVDGDIYFQSDDGTGVGTDTYFFLDGGEKKVKFLEEVVISDDLTVTGSLTITGNIDQYNVTDLDVSDKTITVNSGNTQLLSDGAGLIVDRGSAADASILWDETNDEFDFSHNVTAPNLSITNWNTAYTYSQVGHLPLAGGTVTGSVIIDSGTSMGLKIEHDSFANALELHREHESNAPAIRFTNNNSTEPQIGILYATHTDKVLRWRDGTSSNAYQLFTDNYHPNADQWTAAIDLTVTLTGDVTGTTTESVDGSADKTISITTSYSETDTLDSVTGRGNTTTNGIAVNSVAIGSDTIIGSNTRLTVGNGTTSKAGYGFLGSSTTGLSYTSSGNRINFLSGGVVRAYIQTGGTNPITDTMYVDGRMSVTDTLYVTGDGNSTNWKAAYDYSNVGHLPLAGGTTTGNVTIGGNLVVEDGTISFGDTSGDNHGKLQVYNDAGARYGFDPSDAYHAVLTNEQGSNNQAMALLDTGPTSAADLWGVSVTSNGSNPLTGDESGWIKKIWVTGSGIVGASAGYSIGTTTVIDANRKIIASTGSAALPAFTFENDLNTGMYRSGVDALSFSTNGVSRATFDSRGLSMQQDHFVYRRFEMDAVDNDTQVYILLCEFAANNDVNGTITMDRTSGLRHAAVIDVLVSSGSGTTPVGTMRVMGTSGQTSGLSYRLVKGTHTDSKVYIAVELNNPDAHHETTGAYFTGRIKTTVSSTELTAVGDLTSKSNFDVQSVHQIGEDEILTAEADTLDSVTDRGATTTNSIIINDLTVNDITSSGDVILGGSTDINMAGSAAGQLKIQGNGYAGAIALNDDAMQIYHNAPARNLVLGVNETAIITLKSGQIDTEQPIYASDDLPLAQYHSTTTSAYFGSTGRSNIVLAAINKPKWRDSNAVLHDVVIVDQSQNVTLGTISSGAITSSSTVTTGTGSASNPAYGFSADSGNGAFFEWYVQADSKGQVSFATDGARRARVNEAGIWSDANIYLPTSGSLRSFGSFTEITNGTTGSGFKFRNTADGVDSLVITSAGNGTFAGRVTASDGTLVKAAYGFDSSTTTGISYSSTNNRVNILSNGAVKAYIQTGSSNPLVETMDVDGYITWDGGSSTNANTAYGWGDHSTAGYLTAEADTLGTVTGRNSTTTNSIGTGSHTISDGKLVVDVDNHGGSGTSSFAIELKNSNDSAYDSNALTAYNATTSWDMSDRVTYMASSRANAGSIYTFMSDQSTEPVAVERIVQLDDSNTNSFGMRQMLFYQYDGDGSSNLDFKSSPTGSLLVIGYYGGSAGNQYPFKFKADRLEAPSYRVGSQLVIDDQRNATFANVHVNNTANLNDGTNPDISANTIYGGTKIVTPKLVFLNDSTGDDNYITCNDGNNTYTVNANQAGAWYEFIGDKYTDPLGANASGAIVATYFKGKEIELSGPINAASFGVNRDDPYYKVDVRFSNSTTSLTGGSSGNWGGDGIRIENTNATAGTLALAHFRTGDADWHIGSERVGQDQANFVFMHEAATKVLFDKDGKIESGVIESTVASGEYSLIKQTGQTFTTAATGLTGLAIVSSGDSASYNIFEAQTAAGTALQVRNNGDLRVLNDLIINGTTRINSAGNATLGTTTTGALTAGNISGTSLSISGAFSISSLASTGTVSGSQFRASYGSVSAPAYTFKNDDDTGMYGVGGSIKFAVNGSSRFNIGATATTVTGRISVVGDIQAGTVPQTVIDSSRNLTNIGTISSGAITSSAAVVSTSVESGNPQAATDQVRLSGFGLMGNRTNLYITNANASGFIELGVGGAHNANPALTVSASNINAHGSTLTSGAITVNGHIQQNNNNELRGKDTGGAARTLVRVNSANTVQFGWSGSGDVEFIGGGSYTSRMAIKDSTGNIEINSELLIANTATSSQPLTLGSSSQTNYTYLGMDTSAHDNEAYLIAYGADHTIQAGNFAMKNLEANGEIFFELASSNIPLSLSSDGALFSKTSTGNTVQLATFLNGGGNAGNGARLWLSGTNTDTRGAFIDAVAETTANDHTLRFGVSASGAAPTEVMRIASTGVTTENSVVIKKGSTSGTFIDFQKSDGTVVGRINYSAGDNLAIYGTATNHAGMNFIGNAIIPMSGGSETNDAIALGDGTRNWSSIFTQELFVGATNVLNDARRLRNIDRLGVNTSDPGVRLDVVNAGIGSVTNRNSTYTMAVLESDDAHIDVLSSSAGTWGSTINLREAHSGAFRNSWSISRKTGTAPDLNFNFGTANDHNINDIKVVFSSTGDITATTAEFSTALDRALTVASTDATTGIQFTDNSDTGYFYYVGSVDHFYTTSAKFSVNGSTLASGYNLQVNGSANITSSARISGPLTLAGSTSQINMQNSHHVFRSFQVDAADADGVIYILLCEFAASNDVNGTITMDRTSGLRHACSLDILISSGTGTTPIGTMRSMGTSGNGAPTYKLVKGTHTDNKVYVAVEITNPDDYYESSGAYFTGRIATTVSSTEFTAVGSLTSITDFGANSSHQINGSNVDVGGEADTLDSVTDRGATTTNDITVGRVIGTAANGSNLYALTLTRSGTGTTTPDLIGSDSTLVLGTSSSVKAVSFDATDGADFAGALSSGGTTILSSTRRFYASSGTTVKAAYSFDGDSGTGISRTAAGRLDFLSGGAVKAYIQAGSSNPISPVMYIGGYTDINGDLDVSGDLDVVGDITAAGNTVSAEVGKFDASGTMPASCKLHVGAINTTSSSAVAQFGGFIRVGGPVIIHDGPASGRQNHIEFEGTDITFRTIAGDATGVIKTNGYKIGTTTTPVITSTRDFNGVNANFSGDINLNTVGQKLNLGTTVGTAAYIRHGDEQNNVGSVSIGSDNNIDFIETDNGTRRFRFETNNGNSRQEGNHTIIGNIDIHCGAETTGTARIRSIGQAGDPCLEFSDNGGDQHWAIGADDRDVGYFTVRFNGSTAFPQDWTSNGSMCFEINGGSTNKDIVFNGNVTAYSDIRIKENIEQIPDALSKVHAIRGITYDRIDSSDGRRTGVIAQEVEAVLPEVVRESKDGIKSVDYGNMAGLLIEALKEADRKIELLTKRIEELEHGNN